MSSNLWGPGFSNFWSPQTYECPLTHTWNNLLTFISDNETCNCTHTLRGSIKLNYIFNRAPPETLQRPARSDSSQLHNSRCSSLTPPPRLHTHSNCLSVRLGPPLKEVKCSASSLNGCFMPNYRWICQISNFEISDAWRRKAMPVKYKTADLNITLIFKRKPSTFY